MSVHDFRAPLVIEDHQKAPAQLTQTPLQGSDLRWSITPWGELFQLMEDVHSCEFRVGK